MPHRFRTRTLPHLRAQTQLLENAKRAALLTGLAPLFEATAAEAFSVPAGAMQVCVCVCVCVYDSACVRAPSTVSR